MTPFSSSVDGAQPQLDEHTTLVGTYSAMSTPLAHKHCDMPTAPADEVLPWGHGLHACRQSSAFLYVPGAHPVQLPEPLLENPALHTQVVAVLLGGVCEFTGHSTHISPRLYRFTGQGDHSNANSLISWPYQAPSGTFKQK